MSQGACLTFWDHFNTLERQVADQLPSPKRFPMPSLVSLGATPSYVERRGGEQLHIYTFTLEGYLRQIIIISRSYDEDYECHLRRWWTVVRAIYFLWFTDWCLLSYLAVSWQAFTIIDQNRDGIISKDDLRDVLATMGQLNVKNEELEAMVKEASGPINFTVFLTMFGEKLKGVLGLTLWQFKPPLLLDGHLSLLFSFFFFD